MSSLNRVILTGNLGSDPVIRSFGDNKRVAEFSIAVQDRAKKTTWWDIKCYGDKLVDNFIEPYIKKGCLIAVDGRLCKDIYEKDGMKQSKSYIVSEELKILSSASDKSAATGGHVHTTVIDKSGLVEDDAVPF